MTFASSVAAMVSASSPSAPIGVFSSWLTLATKSRRTLSTRRDSEMSRVKRDRAHDFAVAPQRERRGAAAPAAAVRTAGARVPTCALSSASCSSSLDRVLGEHLTRARVREPARDRVAHDLAPDAIDDDDRIGRLVERGEQPVLHGLGVRDPILGVAPLLGDRLDHRRVLFGASATRRTSSSSRRASSTRRRARDHRLDPAQRRRG